MKKKPAKLKNVRMQQQQLESLRTSLKIKKRILLDCAGKIFQKFKEKKFVITVGNFEVRKSRIVFKINMKLMDKYPKMKNDYFMKNHYFMIKEICKENPGEFE